MNAQTCPEVVYSGGWGSSHKCGRPVKRDGLCGLHASAKERRERNDAERRDRERERRDVRAERGQIAAAISRATGLLVEAAYSEDLYAIDHAAALAWLRTREEGEK